MNIIQNKARKTFVLVATLAMIGAVTGCHKKASGIDANSLGPAPAAPEVPTATLKIGRASCRERV